MVLARILRRVLLPPLIVLLVSFDSAGAVDAVDARQAKLAAAYVFNFLKFIEWPVTANLEEIDVCFSGADDIRMALTEAVQDKPAGDRRIRVRAVDQAGGYSGCDVLYVDATSTLKWPSRSVEGLLTIGDSSTFTADGGVIRLYVDNNRLRFIINVDHAKRARLQVSSNLLKLATRIEQGS
jgi:YfiR/HmsC-like